MLIRFNDIAKDEHGSAETGEYTRFTNVHGRVMIERQTKEGYYRIDIPYEHIKAFIASIIRVNRMKELHNMNVDSLLNFYA